MVVLFLETQAKTPLTFQVIRDFFPSSPGLCWIHIGTLVGSVVVKASILCPWTTLLPLWKVSLPNTITIASYAVCKWFNTLKTKEPHLDQTDASFLRFEKAQAWVLTSWLYLL
jgi:hypothetical protein